jgi:hypothetical protein
VGHTRLQELEVLGLLELIERQRRVVGFVLRLPHLPIVVGANDGDVVVVVETSSFGGSDDQVDVGRGVVGRGVTLGADDAVGR